MRRPTILIPNTAPSRSGLVLPTGYADGSASGPPGLRTQLAEGSGIAVVAAGQPDLTDIIFKAVPAESDLGFETSSLPELRDMVAQLPFDTAMVLFARLAAEAWHIGANRHRQLALAQEVFPSGLPVVGAIEQFLAESDGGAVFVEQQLFALMRLALEVGPSGSVAEGDDKALREFAWPAFRALLAALTVVTDSIDELPGADSDVKKWLAVLIQNGGYNAKAPPLNAFVRGQRLLELSLDEQVGEPQDRCDVVAWLEEDHQLSPAEQFAVGFALAATVGALDENHPLGERSLLGAQRVDETLRQLKLFDRKAQVLDLISAPREWYVEQFALGEDTAMDVAWRRTPFEKRPFLRWGEGHLLLLSPRGILSWLGDGFHHRVFAAAERRGTETKLRYSRYYGQLVEAYALELAESVYPPLGGAGRVHGEQRYGKGGGSKTSDISIDSGPDLVLFEVAGGRLTEPSRVLAQWDRIEFDLEKLLLRRIKKLDGSISALLSGAAVIPHVERTTLRRIWPVIVTAGDVFQSELLWDYIDAQASALLKQPQVQHLTLLDLDDFELLLGLVEDGASVVDVLRRKAASSFRQLDLQHWRALDPTAPREKRPSVLDERMREVFASVAEHLGFDPSKVRAEPT